MPSIRRYHLHELDLTASADRADLLDCVHEVVGPYAANGPAAGEPFTLEIHAATDRPLACPPGLRLFWQGVLPTGEPIAYRCSPTTRFVELEGVARMRIDLPARRAELAVADARPLAALADGCILPMLCEFLAAIDQFVLHAACLAAGDGPDAPAVLIAAASGAGKTTTSLALSAGRFRMLTDDVCFMSESAGVVRAWGLACPCKIYARTIELLPWLARLERRPGRMSGEYLVDSPNAFPVGRQVRPAAVVFLAPRNDGDHRLTPLSKAQAVSLLTAQTVRATDPTADGPAGRGFRMLVRLLAAADAWELSAGPDVAGLADRIADLMPSAGGGMEPQMNTD